MAERAGRRTTITDVARRAGVDKAIVSRVVNADERLTIRPDTRARVESAIKELDYVPNLVARNLRTAVARTFGLLIPDFANPVYAEVIAGAELAASRAGWVLLTASIASHVASGQAVTTYLDILDRDRVDGLLIAGRIHHIESLRRLRAVGLPWLTVNNRDLTFKRYVALDDRRAAATATRYLIGLGHRDIAHIAGPKASETADRRIAGFQDALSEAGIDANQDRIERADYTPEGGYQAAVRLIERHVPVTAIFVANVSSAVGVLDALHRAGLSVPGKISVITIHDHALAQHLTPSLTTIRMPLRRLGERAVELLCETDSTASVEEILDGPMELVVRDSTSPPS